MWASLTLGKLTKVSIASCMHSLHCVAEYTACFVGDVYDVALGEAVDVIILASVVNTISG